MKMQKKDECLGQMSNDSLYRYESWHFGNKTIPIAFAVKTLWSPTRVVYFANIRVNILALILSKCVNAFKSYERNNAHKSMFFVG